MGGGLILNGELYTGFNGNAGEFGNLVVQWRRGTTLEDVFRFAQALRQLFAIHPDIIHRASEGFCDLVNSCATGFV